MNSTISEILLIVAGLTAGFVFIKFGKTIGEKVGNMNDSVSKAIDTALGTSSDNGGDTPAGE
jgi:hypothetical protein